MPYRRVLAAEHPVGIYMVFKMWTEAITDPKQLKSCNILKKAPKRFRKLCYQIQTENFENLLYILNITVLCMLNMMSFEARSLAKLKYIKMTIIFVIHSVIYGNQLLDVFRSVFSVNVRMQ